MKKLSILTTTLLLQDIFDKKKWLFTGDFDGYDLQTSLKCLLQWIIIGLKIEVDLAPLPSSLTPKKSKKQFSYNSIGANFHDSVKTPFTIGLQFYMHRKIKIKKAN